VVARIPGIGGGDGGRLHGVTRVLIGRQGEEAIGNNRPFPV